MSAVQYLYVAGGHIRDAIAALRDWARVHSVGGKSTTVAADCIEPYLELKQQFRLLQQELDKGLPDGVSRWLLIDSRSPALPEEFHRKCCRVWRLPANDNYIPVYIDGDYLDDAGRCSSDDGFDSGTACWQHVDRDSADSVRRVRAELAEELYRVLQLTMADTEAWKNVMLLIRL